MQSILGAFLQLKPVVQLAIIGGLLVLLVLVLTNPVALTSLTALLAASGWGSYRASRSAKK